MDNEVELHEVILKGNPIEDAYLEGFHDAITWLRPSLPEFMDADDTFEAAWSYKEHYLNKLKENG